MISYFKCKIVNLCLKFNKLLSLYNQQYRKTCIFLKTLHEKYYPFLIYISLNLYLVSIQIYKLIRLLQMILHIEYLLNIFMNITIHKKQPPFLNLKEKLILKIQYIINKLEEVALYVRNDYKSSEYYQFCETLNEQISNNLLISKNSFLKLHKEINRSNANLKATQYIINYIHFFLQSQNFKNQNPLQRTIWVLELQTKLNVMNQFLQFAMFMKDDITTLPKYRYSYVWSKIRNNSIGTLETIQQINKFVKQMMRVTTSSTISQQSVNNSILKKVVFGCTYPVFFFHYNQAELRAFKYFRNPTIKQTQNIWNLPQSGAIKQFYKIPLDSIETNQQLYFPIQYHPIKCKSWNIYENNGNSVPVRLLYFEKLEHKQKKTMLLSCQNLNQLYPNIQTLIIHLHGGGFISLSSFTMQAYTRKWANQLKIPILSIDYRKPPQYRFPTGLYDCLSIYLFTINCLSNYFNINPKKIILAGDSAGGNLVCSLNALILKEKIQPVHSMLLAYPAVDARKRYSPSRINAFQEPILYPTTLLLCMKQYLGNVQLYQDHPLASPILLTQQFCNNIRGNNKWPTNWPKTTIMIGKRDPLYDDSLRLMQKMIESKIDCHCEVYTNFSHAFLSMQQVIPECKQIILDSIQFLKILMK